MSINRNRIRDRAAAAALRIARRAGIQCEFRNPAASIITVYGFIEESTQSAGLRGGDTDDFRYVFVIPRQTNFPPAAFSPGAQIRYPVSTGTWYQIDDVEPDNEDILQASTWRLRCGRYGDTVEMDP